MENANKKVYTHPSSTSRGGPVPWEIFLRCCCLQNKKLRLCAHSVCLIFQHCVFVPYIKAEAEQAAQESVRFVRHRQGAEHQLHHRCYCRVARHVQVVLPLLECQRDFNLAINQPATPVHPPEHDPPIVLHRKCPASQDPLAEHTHYPRRLRNKHVYSPADGLCVRDRRKLDGLFNFYDSQCRSRCYFHYHQRSTCSQSAPKPREIQF